MGPHRDSHQIHRRNPWCRRSKNSQPHDERTNRPKQPTAKGLHATQRKNLTPHQQCWWSWKNSFSNKIVLHEIKSITTILNIDNINHSLDSIQDAVTLSKTSLVSNKILSLREINAIRTLPQDQGVTVDFPDEALQFVIPKLAMRDGMLLYILNVPQLENNTSPIIRIYPLATNNRILHQHPTFTVKRNSNLFTTIKPEDFVQMSAYLNELHDECLASLINGKQATCNYVIQNSKC